MNVAIVLAGSTAIVVLTLALARELRLRRALQRLLSRLLSLWRLPRVLPPKSDTPASPHDVAAACVVRRDVRPTAGRDGPAERSAAGETE